MNRTSLETVWAATGAGVLDWDSEVFGEIRRSNEYIYSGTLYGGYDSYSRANTEYISLGVTNDIATSSGNHPPLGVGNKNPSYDTPYVSYARPA